jgi:hypothetical protein
MQPRAPVPSKRPTGRPLLSKYPGLSPIGSLWPFVKSLRPSKYDVRIITPPESEPPPGAPTVAAPVRGRRALRIAALSIATLAIGGVAFWATRAGHVAQKGAPTRTVTAPTLKAADKGGHVRWHKDAVDVVVDKSFTDLAGPAVFGAAVDAWRATGAMLPSVSTVPGDGKKVGYDPKGANENVVVFAPYGWAKAHGALAVTVLTFDNASGQILDADLLLNGGGRFFANFDHDESEGDDDDSVSIEDVPGATTVTTQSKHTLTPRFDVQSVVTHELGHFFGLGEDYDEKQATMYTSTRPGEIHKRILKQSESTVINALYAESSPDDPKSGEAKGGCGRAQVARGDLPGTVSWMGFVAATLGLGLLAASRRARTDELRVRVRVGRPRRSQKWGRMGGWLTVTGLLAFLSPPELQAATDTPTVRGDAAVQVLGAAPRWADGILETELTFRVTTCHVAPCPDTAQHVVVQGGSLDGVTQVIGPFAVPEVGARMTVKLRDGRGLLRLLDPTFRP